MLPKLSFTTFEKISHQYVIKPTPYPTHKKFTSFQRIKMWKISIFIFILFIFYVYIYIDRRCVCRQIIFADEYFVSCKRRAY